MANTQSQFGFKHIGFLPGFAPDYQQLTRQIQSTFSTNIYFGDPVVKSANVGYVTLPANNTASPLVGIFVGCQFTPSTGGPPQWSPWWPGAATGDATAYIINSPGAILLAATLATAITSANIGDNVGFSTGSGGTTAGGGFSTYVVDQSTLTTSSAWPFQVVGLAPTNVGNGSDPTTNFNWVQVAFNNQQYKSLTGVA